MRLGETLLRAREAGAFRNLPTCWQGGDSRGERWETWPAAADYTAWAAVSAQSRAERMLDEYALLGLCLND